MSEAKKNELHSLNILDDIIVKAQKAGADAVDAVRIQGTSTSVSYRLGDVEEIERSEAHDLGLRVMIGKQQAFVSSNDTKPEVLDELVARAISMAKNMPEDEYCGQANPDLLARDIPELDLYDPTVRSAEELIETAKATEEAALAVEGITNSEGASSGFGQTSIALATSGGFRGSYSSSYHSVGISVIAGTGTGMERDYDYDSPRFFADMRDPEAVGKRAGERAIQALNPQKMPSASVPVVYSNRISGGLVGHLSGAINGASVARGTSFLKDSMGEMILPKGVNVIDNPHRIRGVASKPFDGEGVANSQINFIEDGVLQSWVLNSASARQLGLETNGRATRGTSSPPGSGMTNLYMEAGDQSVKELIKDIKSGLFITSLIGFGVNGVTGDYSRGASGFWIEDGEIAHAVSELTVAGNLKDMFANLTPANDLEFIYGTNAPTIRIDGMMVAGT